MLRYFLFVFVYSLIQLHIVTSSQKSICNKPEGNFPVVDLVSVNNSWQLSIYIIGGCFNTVRSKSRDNFVVSYWKDKNVYEWILFKLRASVELTAVDFTPALANKYNYAYDIVIYTTNNPSLKTNFTNHCEAGDYTGFNEQDWTYCGTLSISKNGQTYRIKFNKPITAKYILLQIHVHGLNNSVDNSDIFLDVIIASFSFHGLIKCNYSLHIKNETILTDGSTLTASIESDGDANMTTATCQATLKNSTVIQLNKNTGVIQHKISSSWDTAKITCTVADQQVLEKTICFKAKPTLDIVIDSNSFTNAKLSGKVIVDYSDSYQNLTIQCFIQTDLDTKNITLTDNTTKKISSSSTEYCKNVSVYTARFEISADFNKNNNAGINCSFNFLNRTVVSSVYFNLTNFLLPTTVSTNEDKVNRNNYLAFIINGVILVIVAVAVAVILIIKYRKIFNNKILRIVRYVNAKYRKPFQHKTNKRPKHVAREESVYENDKEDFNITDEKNEELTEIKLHVSKKCNKQNDYTTTKSTKAIVQEDEIYENDDQD